MNTHVIKYSQDQNISAAHKVGKYLSKGSTFQFTDNRPETILKNKLTDLVSNSTRVKDVVQKGITGIQVNGAPVQRAKSINVKSKTDKIYTIEASGTPSEFTGGSGAGDFGIEGVDAYKASFLASDQKNKNGGRTGKSKGEESQTMDNRLPEYVGGHLLPKEMGGPGTGENVFEQEGGQNSGSWRSFEIAAANALWNTPDDKTFTYEMSLGGKKLKYNF